MTALYAFSPTLYWTALVLGVIALHFAHAALGVHDPGGPTGWRKVVVRLETLAACL